MFLSLMGDTPQLPPDPIHSMNKSGDRRLSQIAHPVNSENQSSLTIPKLLMTKSKTTSKTKQLQSSGCWLVATITQLSTYPLLSALWLGPFTTFASCSQVSLWQQCWGAEAGGGERAVFLLGCLGSLQYCPSSWPPPESPRQFQDLRFTISPNTSLTSLITPLPPAPAESSSQACLRVLGAPILLGSDAPSKGYP